jgi:hypothetical protein
MTAHLIADPIATPTDPTDPTWLALSVAMTDEVPVIADRDDLLVSIAPGAGRGAPACFLPALATIEVDGYHLGGVDPATVAPHRIGDRARYAPAWGLLVHECGHARHSVWEAPPGTAPGAVAAAMLLEESRIEAAQVRRRPDDRHWLRASATHLILADTKSIEPGCAPAMIPADAAHTAALLLARVDAGILTSDEVEPVTRTVTTVLGQETLDELCAIWTAAHTVDDTDADAMIELGRRWCEVLGTDPADPPTDPADRCSTGPSAMTGAIADALRRIDSAVAREPVPADPGPAAPDPASADDVARAAAEALAATVFGAATAGAPGTGGASPVTGTRAPTQAERRAARLVGRALTTAGHRERVATRVTSALPPGRLRMRGALAADAQRAAGALPTAEPFSRTVRRAVPTPPLRLGIACDVSSSMLMFTRPVASAAWILAHAAGYARVPATTATVTFGEKVHPITAPGATPSRVTTFGAPDGYEVIDQAIDTLDGALGLSRPGAARLLVIVSDGIFSPAPRGAAQAALDRLNRSGCGVLWLAPDRYATPLRGATVHPLADPATTAQAIAKAATAALRATP